MLSRWLRTWDSPFLRPLVVFLSGHSVTPNVLTIAGLAMFIAAGIAVACEHTVFSAWFLLVGGLLDVLDGELARYMDSANPFGAFLDSLADHCGDLAVYVGLMSYSYRHNLHLPPILILIALFGSLLGSHVRSKGVSMTIEAGQVGCFTRCERILVLVAGLFTSMIIPALFVLASGNIVSASQRVAFVMHAHATFPQKKRYR